jgi:hypothetical protein
VKLPLGAGVRRTKWLVCAYLSPSHRLVRCVEGFVSAEEERSPFALASLCVCSLHNGDGGPRDGGASASRGGSPTVHTIIQERVPYGSVPFKEAQRHARVAEFELDSVVRGSVRVKMRDEPFRIIQEIGPGFYNVRAPFLVLLGTVDVGAHMSFVRLKDGKFLALGALDPDGKIFFEFSLSTPPLTPPPYQLCCFEWCSVRKCGWSALQGGVAT